MPSRFQSSRSSQIISAASGKPRCFKNSRNVTVKQQTQLACERPNEDSCTSRSSAYSKSASRARKLNSKSPILTVKRHSANDASSTLLLPDTDRLTELIERIRRSWDLSCFHLLNCRIASSAESRMYVLAARDVGFDVASSSSAQT